MIARFQSFSCEWSRIRSSCQASPCRLRPSIAFVAFRCHTSELTIRAQLMRLWKDFFTEYGIGCCNANDLVRGRALRDFVYRSKLKDLPQLLLYGACIIDRNGYQQTRRRHDYWISKSGNRGSRGFDTKWRIFYLRCERNRWAAGYSRGYEGFQGRTVAFDSLFYAHLVTSYSLA